MADVTKGKNEMRIFTKALMAITSIGTAENAKVDFCMANNIKLGNIVCTNRETRDLRCNLAIQNDPNCGAHIDLIHKDGSAYVVAFAPKNSISVIKEMVVSFTSEGEISENFANWFRSAMTNTNMTIARLATNLCNIAETVFNPSDKLISREFFNTYATFPTELVADDVYDNLPYTAFIKDNSGRNSTVCLSNLASAKGGTSDWVTEPLSMKTSLSATIVIQYRDSDGRTETQPLFAVDIADGDANIIPYAGDHLSNNYVMSVVLVSNQGAIKSLREINESMYQQLTDFAHTKKIKDTTDEKDLDKKTMIIVPDAAAKKMYPQDNAISLEDKLSYGKTYPFHGSISVKLSQQVSKRGDAHFTVFVDHNPIAKLYVSGRLDNRSQNAIQLMQEDVCQVSWAENVNVKTETQFTKVAAFNHINEGIVFVSRLIDMWMLIKDINNAVKRISIDIPDNIPLDDVVVQSRAKIDQKLGTSGMSAAPEATVYVSSPYNNAQPFVFNVSYNDCDMFISMQLKLYDDMKTQTYTIPIDGNETFDQIINCDVEGYGSETDQAIASAFKRRIETFAAVTSNSSGKMLGGKENIGQLADMKRMAELYHIRPNTNTDAEDEAFGVDPLFAALDKAKRAYVNSFDPDRKNIIKFGQMKTDETPAVRRYDSELQDTTSYVYSISVNQGNGGFIVAMYTSDGSVGLYSLFDGHVSRDIKFDSDDDEYPMLDPDFMDWFIEKCRITDLKPQTNSQPEIDPTNPFSSMFGVTGMDYINDDSED